MKFICLQAGHENIETNCDLALRTGTGAPGEKDFTPRVRNRLKDILLSKKNADGTPAFQVQLVDANFNCDPTANKNDYALFLAIHYESDSHQKGGGMIAAADPSIDDANTESVRIAQIMRNEYFKNSGIDEHEEWTTPAMTLYYMWAQLSPKTPCVIIECGVGQNAHDKVILADTDRVCNAIARGICKAFNVPFDTVTPVPQPTPPLQPNYKKGLQDILKIINSLGI